MKKLFILLFASLLAGTVFSQSKVAYQVYRNGKITKQWQLAKIDSIRFSKVGIDGTEQQKYVTQVIYTSTGSEKLTLAEIDSVVLREPQEIPAEAVDLGLSVKWAAYNVGATASEDFGGMYGWADPTGENVSLDADEYPSATPPENISGTKYDIARAKWGGKWRLPTYDEISELVQLEWDWTTINGVEGVQFVAANGNKLFVPAAGVRFGTEIKGRGGYKQGYAWSGTLSTDSKSQSVALGFSMNAAGYVDANREAGLSVRPVISE